MLTDMQLRALKPTGKAFKVADAQGLYAAVTRTGVISFRFDYRLAGRRETLMIGKYDQTLGARKTRNTDQLSYGQPVTLAEARQLLARAQREVQGGSMRSGIQGFAEAG